VEQTYCQIYCQKRGGEGIPGDGEVQVFSNLLISICVYVGSNPTLSATQSSRAGLPCETHILQAETASFHTDSRLILTAETRCVCRFYDVRRPCSDRDGRVSEAFEFQPAG
jgi:hypothetical protein